MTIYGYNLTDATAVNFGGNSTTDFQVNGDGSITAISPPGAGGLVNITVTTPEGTSPVTTAGVFTYVAVPEITGISPASGPLVGGNTVEISGTGLYNDATVTTVDFGGVPGTILNEPDGFLVEVPAGVSLGTVNVTVTNGAGTSSISPPGDQYTYLPPPVVSGLSSSSSSIEGGTTVTITGTLLANATEVDFGPDNPATIVSDTDDQIVVINPGGAGGTVDVTVTTSANGTSNASAADKFTFTDAPFISSLSNVTSYPVGLVSGGDTVDIYGNDLDGATAVDFGPNNPAQIVFDYVNHIQVVTPPGLAGTVDVTVTNSNGTSDILPSDQFTYVAFPTVSSVSPSSGTVDGGTQVTISGAGFTDAKWVSFGSTVVTDFSATDSQIVVTSPYWGIPGEMDVTVTTPLGTSAITEPADQFTYVDPPEYIGLDTTSGPVVGGTPVTIAGVGLANATEVDFGGNPATIVPGSNTGSQLLVLSPEATGDATGPVDVTVTTPIGSATVPGGFTYALPPSISTISQSTGPAAGGTAVTISGDNLSTATGVDFGGVPAASFMNNGIGTLSAVSPGGDISTVDVTVVWPGGTSPTVSADQFTYVGVPSITSISPASGSGSGGDLVTITGTALANATAVEFGGFYGYTGTIVSNTDSQIVVESGQALPSMDGVGTVDVQVVTAGGTSATSAADQFTYVLPPSVSGISLSSGNRDGGDYVTISGSNLIGATAVDFGPNPATIIDESYYDIDVYSPAGTVGTVPVTVVAPGGTAAAGNFMYFQAAPLVSAVSPSAGAAAAATTVIITGTDLDGATAVDFGGVAGTIVAGSDTPTQIMATSPAGTFGMVDVTVTTPAGTSAVWPLDQFTGTPAPAVSSTESAIGPLGGNTDVVINGSGLAGATAVNFGQTLGTILSDSDSYILAASPVGGSAGAVDITVTTPYGTSAASLSSDGFTYIAAPSATAASYAATAGSTLSVPAVNGVLANDSDPQGLPLSATLLTTPTNGILSLASDGSFSYTPNSGFTGPDSFTYEATNGYASSAPTTVSLTVGLATLTWMGTTGNWTDTSWGSPLYYPDTTFNASIGGMSSVVNVPLDQAANALTIQSGATVAVGPGAVLSVTTDTSVTGGATLSVDPNGLFSTGGTLILDTGGSLNGGPITAAAYQLNDGTVSANLSGPGGVTVGNGGTVTLSGDNSYTGPTLDANGTLIAASQWALPAGSSLFVGAGAGTTFGASQTAPSLSSSQLAAPAASMATASATSTPAGTMSPWSAAGPIADTAVSASVVPADSPFVHGHVESLSYGGRQVENLSYGPVAAPPTLSRAKVDAVFTLHRSAFDLAVSPVDGPQVAGAWAWLAAIEMSWNSTNQHKTSDPAAAAVDMVLARYEP